jgi:hypothetical protein
MELGVKCGVVKLVECGYFVKTVESEIYLPGMPAGVVDTTGANDAFASGFTSGLIDILSPAESARSGCAAGSLEVRSIGVVGWFREEDGGWYGNAVRKKEVVRWLFTEDLFKSSSDYIRRGSDQFFYLRIRLISPRVSVAQTVHNSCADARISLRV